MTCFTVLEARSLRSRFSRVGSSWNLWKRICSISLYYGRHINKTYLVNRWQGYQSILGNDRHLCLIWVSFFLSFFYLNESPLELPREVMPFQTISRCLLLDSGVRSLGEEKFMSLTMQIFPLPLPQLHCSWTYWAYTKMTEKEADWLSQNKPPDY